MKIVSIGSCRIAGPMQDLTNNLQYSTVSQIIFASFGQFFVLLFLFEVFDDFLIIILIFYQNQITTNK